MVNILGGCLSFVRFLAVGTVLWHENFGDRPIDIPEIRRSLASWCVDDMGKVCPFAVV